MNGAHNVPKTFEVWAILFLIKYIKFQNFNLKNGCIQCGNRESGETSGVKELHFFCE